MYKLISSLATAFLLAACGQNTQVGQMVATDAEQAPVALQSGIIFENFDKSVRPGDDFNAFVNGAWMKTAEIPPDRSGTSVGLDLHEDATEAVRVIIDEAANGDFADGTDDQKVGDLYKSYMDMEIRNDAGVEPLKHEFAAINALQSHDDLAAFFAEANKIGTDLPFGLYQWVDMKADDSYMMITYQQGLGMPEREYYFKDDKESQEIRNAYLAHMEKMFELAELPEPAASAQTIMALETRLAEGHIVKEKARQWDDNYNKIPVAELSELMPDFNWDDYLEVAGIADIDALVIWHSDYHRALNEIITSTPMKDWKTYLTWKTLNSNAHLLTEELDVENWEFYSKTLHGTEKILPRWKRAVANVNNTLGEVVGKVYVARHFSPEAKAHMHELVSNLIKAYGVSIRELDWMGDETKAEALDKLSKFTPKIGYPDKWKDYSALRIADDDIVGNLQRSARFEYEINIARQDGPVDKTEWAMTPQTVNAYYSPSRNEIVFPAAYLQPPNFDLSVEDAVNYGAIGATIGHEIGHGFDNTGSTFDGDGKLRNWWTDGDREEFENRTDKLIEQYNQFKPFPDLAVNGEYTQGENIGDLGGMAIALKAYQISLNGEEAPVIDGYTGVQRVFLGYGQSWRSLKRDEAVRQQIATDPHAPAMYRLNGVVRNIPEFYEAFDVTETDELYLPQEERVKIW